LNRWPRLKRLNYDDWVQSLRAGLTLRLFQSLEMRSLRQMKFRNGVFDRIGSAIAALAASAVAAAAQDYIEVRGSIQDVTFGSADTNKPGNIVTNKPIQFVCVFGGDKWRIDNNFARGGEVIWYFDGRTVYESILPTNRPSARSLESARRLGLASVPFEIARSNVTIRVAENPGGHPWGNAGVNLPWLAFCSGSYLNQPGRVVPIPIATLRHAPDGFGYTDVTEVFEDDLGLPVSIDLLTSKERYEKSVNDHLFRAFRYPPAYRSSGFPDGVLKFRYRVVELTNFMGRNIPLRFEFAQYEAEADRRWFARYQGVGEVASVCAATEPQSVFRPEMKQTMVDTRFTDSERVMNSIVYQTTNSHLDETNDPELRKFFFASKERALKGERAKPLDKRMLFILMLILTSSVPLGLLVVAYFKKRRSQKP
jgi:hypothetical protein